MKQSGQVIVGPSLGGKKGESRQTDKRGSKSHTARTSSRFAYKEGFIQGYQTFNQQAHKQSKHHQTESKN
jgi:hypothetical protein